VSNQFTHKVKKSKSTLQKLFFLIFFCWTASIASAQQTGKIAGKVIDKKTGETLIGLTVKVEGLSIGAATDVEGRFVLGSLPQGKYTLVFKYIGYQTKTISDVEVKAGALTPLNISMDESSSQTLAEVVVTATYRQESIGALYAQQKNAVNMSSGISTELIQRSPDKNTSEVLKRVSGASIQNNKFVVIRGLADRYNNNQLNNAILPSTEPDRKAFSFDIIPSNLVDKIVINKTASPDLPGDFAGGSIKIFTKDVPDEGFINFSTGWGYNTISTFRDFVSNERGKYDYFGFDDGNRKLPGQFPANFAQYNPLSNQEKANFSKLLPNSFGQSTYEALPSQNYQFSWGNRYDLKNEGSLGAVFSVSYRNSQNQLDIVRNDYQNLFADIYYNYDDQQYSFNTNLGLLANITYKNGKNKYSFKNLFNRVFDQAYTTRFGYNDNIAANLQVDNSELTQKSILNTQLEGEHQFGTKDQKLNWNLSLASINRDQPDLRTIYYREIALNSNQFELVDRNSRRFFSDMKEQNYSGQLNYSLPMSFFGKKSTFKTGALSVIKTRDFNARIFNYLYNSSGSGSFDAYILSLPKDKIFAPENIKANGGFILTDFTNNTDSYQAQTLLNAGYAMLDNQLSEKSRLIWGARLEHYYQNIDYVDLSSTARSFDQEFIDVLPSLNYTYSINDKSNLRFAVSRTVSRPELRELAPFAFFDFISQTNTVGLPSLKRGQINNFDFKYETYPKNGETFSISLFYKDFNDAIEQTLDEGGTPERRIVNFANVPQATSYGLELEFRKRLDFISSSRFFQDLTVFSNFSYIKSDVKFNNAGIANRPLQGQSPYLINSGIQYSNAKSGLAITALYNRVGERIAFVGNTTVPNIWENARDVLDLQISKKMLKEKIELKANFSDILNQRSVLYFNMDNNNAYDRHTDKNYVSNLLGTNISFTISYDISLRK